MLSALVAAVALQTLPNLRVEGKHLVEPRGRAVALRGCNLGNWFVIEPWMLQMADGPGAVRDQYTLESVLTERFGDVERQRLMNLYRQNWIGPRDMKIIRSFGMNLLRLPLNYRQFEDDEQPFRLRKDAWQWVDRAVDLAEAEGLYTILDMHGVPGGQTENDHTGRAGENKLWGSETNQARLAWLWGELARRYRNRSAVVAYDVFNEPYGGSKPEQLKIFRNVLASIRKADPDKLVFAHGHYDDFSHYGDPRKNGWRNVGFEMHYYPGLFGGGDPTPMTHARHLASLRFVAEQVDRLNVPFLVGEMNVVFNAAGGAALMRRTFDTHAKYGWMTTMWSYRLTSEGGLGENSWGMVANAEPRTRIDFRKNSREEIAAWMRSLGTEPYAINEPLRKALTSPKPPPLSLPTVPEPMTAPPAKDAMPGWEQADLGSALPGGLRREGNGGFDLFGAGDDVWGRSDACRFVYRRCQTPFSLSATVLSVADVHGFAKGGLMIRESLDPTARTAVLTVFPSGGVQFAVRTQDKEMTVVASATLAFPLDLRLRVADGSVIATIRPAGAVWREVGRSDLSLSPAWAGVISLSHDNRQLGQVRYRNLELTE